MSSTPGAGLRIHVEGEAAPRTLTIGDAEEVLVGRDAAATVRLAHDGVSRRHLRIFRHSDGWFVEDLGSRHGSLLDGVLLAPRRPAPIGRTAMIQIRPFALRVDCGGSTSGPSTDTAPDPGSVIRPLTAGAVEQLNARRISLLLEAAEAIHSARDEQGVARAATTALLAGTGFARVLMLRRLADFESLETLAVEVSADVDAAPSARVSRTLLIAASEGQPVMLEDQAMLQQAESIVGSGVAAALCVPVLVPPAVEAFLYLDSRKRSARPNADAATFCHLVGRLAGLALANLRRVAAEARQLELERQLDAARRAQQQLLPPEHGRHAGGTWRLYTRPGLVVAGDIAGVHPADDRVTFFVGDVRGKGVDAAIVMALVSAHLASGIEQGLPLEEIVTRTNTFVHAHRRDESDFVSLFAVQVDRAAGRWRAVDAGHGLALVVGGGRTELFASDGGTVLGFDPGTAYEASEGELRPGSRFILFTDGLVEQRAADSETMLGLDRVLAELEIGGAPSSDVERLATLLRTHAGSEHFADDVTILSVAADSDPPPARDRSPAPS